MNTKEKLEFEFSVTSGRVEGRLAEGKVSIGLAGGAKVLVTPMEIRDVSRVLLAIERTMNSQGEYLTSVTKGEK